MKSILYIFFGFYIISNLQAEDITLNAQVTYTNKSSEIINKVYHRITIPSTREYQKVNNITVMGSNNFKIKQHKKDVTQKYIEFLISLPPYSSKEVNIQFKINLSSHSYELNDIQKNIKQQFINTSSRIESASKEFQIIASNIMKRYPNISDQVIAAYKYPTKILHYQVQKKTTALTALKTKRGDCTEYAMVFVAICRAMHIPARVVNLFNIKNKYKTWSQPNHNEAEIYIPSYGWMPIYSNLGLGSLTNNYSPGKISNTNIIYSQNVWTWSNYLPHTKHLKGLIKQKTIWSVK